MREEAQWVITTHALLVLKLDRPLANYLGSYRWNTQRQTHATVSKPKTAMWAAVGKYRHIEVRCPDKTLPWSDAASSLAALVEVACSICHSVVSKNGHLRTVTVDLGNLFARTVPFNDDPGHLAFAVLMWDVRDPASAYDKLVLACGNNLLRLVQAVAKYRGASQWKFVADTRLGEDAKGGLEWLEKFQVECAKHDMLLAHGDCETA